MPKAQRNQKIWDILEVARRGRMEFVAQVVLMTFAGAVAWVTTGVHFIPLWVAAHFGLITVERKLTRRLRNSDSPFALPCVLMAHLAIGAVFAAMPVYLWLQEDEAFHFTGMVLLVGSILTYSQLSRRSELPAIRASGVSAWRFLGPVMVLAFLTMGQVFHHLVAMQQLDHLR